MPDVLLRERAAVLARMLKAVENVIDVLEGSRKKAEDEANQEMATGHIDGIAEQVTALMASTEGAQFVSGTRFKFDIAAGILQANLAELRRQLVLPKPDCRVAVRLEQLVVALTDSVSEQRIHLKALIDTLDQPGGLPDEAARAAAWASWRLIEGDCQRLFSDYLDLVRGVALRDSGLDDGLCRIADTLVGDFASVSQAKWTSLTVPASREYRDARAPGFVRIGFPEWSVWTLPLAAVEFASSLLALRPRIIDFWKTTTNGIMGRLTDGNLDLPEGFVASLNDRPDRDGSRLLLASIENLTRMLLIEALATATMGPAYAWSTLLMRVDPRPGRDLVERLRRDVVVATLTQLNAGGQEGAQLDLLESEWGTLLTNAGISSPDGYDAAFASEVNVVVQGVLERVTFRLTIHDWKSISSIANLLIASAPAADTLNAISATFFTPTLRHLLNAAWVGRLARPDLYRGKGAEDDGLAVLSRSVQDLCVAVIDRSPSSPGDQGRGRPQVRA